MTAPRLRIGIDVGGTFTDVVAVDAATRSLVASVKLPTTHDHPDGVAAGIVAGLERLLREHAIDPSAIAFIAHSTTQATNALLEGDVAQVGIVPLGGPVARAFARFAPFALADGVRFAPRWLDPRAGDPLAAAHAAGVEALAVSAPFAVDRPDAEHALVVAARASGLAATGGAEVSTQYGLRARTRTAALNAAILPRMLRTARMTAGAVTNARIPAPLMIMRSDGGVMDVAEVERRPILTMLSGPAAGIAGALFHENVTDGLFVEVGGTSADCSAIVRGRPQMRPARIGGHRTLLRTLDVRTIAVAGGSLARVAHGAIVEVGPRSAHIAGYRYASFTPDLVASAVPDLADGVVALRGANGERIAITPTCAANLLGVVPPTAFARGDAAAARLACERIAPLLGLDADGVARAILDRATERLRATLDELIADYGLDRATVELVGGGGGAAALIPYAAQRLGLTHRLARDAEVISPLGVALALVRDVVERTVVDPSADDLARIRREAIDAATASGAAPDRIEVVVEVDTARNRVRATASGATALVDGAQSGVLATEPERRAAAAAHLHVAPDAPRALAQTGALTVYGAGRAAAIVDERAVVRLTLTGATVLALRAGALESILPGLVDDATTFGDVGRALPDVFVLRGARIGEFAGLGEAAQILALARDELAGVDAGEPVVAITVPKRA
ncbi:MAG TPA: hydantoinase/oxoprolinase family protein [Candidatus Sulfotelmatobacter sp.]|nr:hydantoinase/oxoprolinase family protein [Candidatus Sulfotelmatobacter sp.]